MHSDHNAKEPGSLVWQSEHKLICSDDHTVTLTHAFHAHRHSSRINQPYFSHPSASLTLVLLPSMGSLTQGSTYLGVPHMVYGHISDDLTASLEPLPRHDRPGPKPMVQGLRAPVTM